MGMMNDKISYFDESDKSKGYNIKHGKKLKKTGLLEEVTSKRGRVWVKKLDGSLANTDQNFILCSKQLGDRRNVIKCKLHQTL